MSTIFDRINALQIEALMEPLMARGHTEQLARNRAIRVKHKVFMRAVRQREAEWLRNPPAQPTVRAVPGGVEVTMPGAQPAVVQIGLERIAYGRNVYKVVLVSGEWPADYALVRACDLPLEAPFGGRVERWLDGSRLVSVYTD